MTIYRLGDQQPDFADRARCWVAPGARLIGNVSVAEDVSIWFGAVLRGDNEPISIGAGSNVQDNCVLHTDPGFPLIVGCGCTVGHGAVLHGCILEDGVLVGMSATLLNGARVGRNAIVGAGALLTAGKTYPEGVLILGSPAKVVRPLNSDEIAASQKNADHYRGHIERYRREFDRGGT